ncbi:MAG: hypothetical protein K0R09_1938 [Clostridiales bacterium]|jgi:hypothetical protein|nr:hypothetical protein [Clostridiales bacterium]
MAEGQAAIPQLPGFDINAMTKALGGMNLGPLTGMLNNINLTQLLPLIPTFMKMVGGSGGLGSLFNPGAGAGAGLNPSYYGGGYPVATAPGAVAPAFVVPQHLQADPRFVVLGALKPFLPQDKGIMIDQIIKFLVLYLTISPILPKAPIRPPVPMTAPVVAAVQPSPKSEVPVNT